MFEELITVYLKKNQFMFRIVSFVMTLKISLRCFYRANRLEALIFCDHFKGICIFDYPV